MKYQNLEASASPFLRGVGVGSGAMGDREDVFKKNEVANKKENSGTVLPRYRRIFPKLDSPVKCSAQVFKQQNSPKVVHLTMCACCLLEETFISV